MSLSDAAAALGLPEALVQRSAEARAAESGSSVDDILAAWAGGEAATAAPPPAKAEPEEAAEDTAEEPEEDTAEEPEEAAEPAPPTPVIETPERAAAETPAAPTGAPSRAPVPAEVTAAEAAHLPEVITVPTAGIKERTNFVIPRWLTALMLIAPLFALFALGGSATGACGEATELTTHIISGEIVNCDGSEFTGAGPGGGGSDFIALGGDIYSGAEVAGVNCAGCHGANGQGSAAFPALTGVLTTFGSCEDHVTWVRLGSSGWASEVGETYGDTNKQVNPPGMPGFGNLSDEQLRAVAAFERVRFGGANPEETLVDCGLAEAEGEEGGGGGEGGEGEGEEPAEGDEGESPTETTAPPEASEGS